MSDTVKRRKGEETAAWWPRWSMHAASAGFCRRYHVHWARLTESLERLSRAGGLLEEEDEVGTAADPPGYPHAPRFAAPRERACSQSGRRCLRQLRPAGYSGHSDLGSALHVWPSVCGCVAAGTEVLVRIWEQAVAVDNSIEGHAELATLLYTIEGREEVRWTLAAARLRRQTSTDGFHRALWSTRRERAVSR